jgi:multicomponent Na+:H+ antiporter subunit E
MSATPETHRTIDHGGRMTGVLTRAAGFMLLWLMVSGAAPADLPIGAAAAAAAAWASTGLLPPGIWRPRPVALARMALRFPREALVAGADVARRALDPRLPLRPGFITYPVRLPRGPGRDVFALLTGLLPGTVAVPSDEGEALPIHCLDIDQPVEAQLGAEEARLQRALGMESGDV